MIQREQRQNLSLPGKRANLPVKSMSGFKIVLIAYIVQLDKIDDVSRHDRSQFWADNQQLEYRSEGIDKQELFYYSAEISWKPNLGPAQNG
jgi:hypothetical protein